MTKLLLSVLTDRIQNAGGGRTGLQVGRETWMIARRADRVTLEGARSWAVAYWKDGSRDDGCARIPSTISFLQREDRLDSARWRLL
jgi:hypothetical protein